jgi:hypothetical protein
LVGQPTEYQARVAFYLLAVAEAFEALQAPDPDLEREREVMAGGMGGEDEIGASEMRTVGAGR